MKKAISIILSLIMVFGIFTCTVVNAGAAVILERPGDYTYSTGTILSFCAPYDGWYYFYSYDNYDPYIEIEFEDGSKEKFDDSDTSYEFDILVYLYEGEEINCRLGTYEDDSYINFQFDHEYDVETNRDYTVPSNTYFYFRADHDDYYYISSSGDNDPVLILEFEDETEYRYDDNDGRDFYASIYLDEDEAVYGYVYDYYGTYNDINFSISCDCGNYGEGYFEVGYTYRNVPHGTEFTFVAPYAGIFAFESFGENDPCFEYTDKNDLYYAFDDRNYGSGDLDFYTEVYLYEGEEIECCITDYDYMDNICFSITYVGNCNHTYKDWYTHSEPTASEFGKKIYACESCGYAFDFEVVSLIIPETPKASAANSVGGITVSWNEVEGASEYYVYRRTAGSSSWVLVGSTEETSLFDDGVSNNKFYVYSVRAYNSAGDHSPYDSAKTYTIKCVSTPTLTKIQNATTGIRIDWTKIPGATGYRVYRRGAGSTYWTYLGTTTNLWYVDNAVKNSSGNYYRYTVRAVNSYYSGFDTDGLFIKRLSNPVMKSATSSSSGVTVKWSSVNGALGYNVYRKTAGSGWVKIGMASGVNNTDFVDKTAKKGVTYTYTTKAVCGSYISAYYSTISCKDLY